MSDCKVILRCGAGHADQAHRRNWCGTGQSPQQALTSLQSGREPVFRGDPMAEISEFSIVTYQRKPGQWRAAITRKRSSGMDRGDTMRSVVTPDDYESESEAELAAQKLIRKL